MTMPPCEHCGEAFEQHEGHGETRKCRDRARSHALAPHDEPPGGPARVPPSGDLPMGPPVGSPPDLLPGEVRVLALVPPQFSLLQYVLLSPDVSLTRLQISGIEISCAQVPYEEVPPGDPWQWYRFRDLDDPALRRALITHGAAVATRDTIAVSPNVEIQVHLRNVGTTPAKPRAALLVHEEI